MHDEMPTRPSRSSAATLSRRTFLKTLSGCLLIGGAGMAVAGSSMLVRSKLDAGRYRSLAQPQQETAAANSHENPTADPQAERDWAALLSCNPNTAAWCRIGSTPVDLPVVQANGIDDIAHWLNHNFWGEESYLGCVCADPVLSVSQANTVVYGHHLSTEPDAMFSPLSNAYDQGRFDELGTLDWETHHGGCFDLLPLCAAQIDEHDELFLSPSWLEASLPDWLFAHAERSQAKAFRCIDRIAAAQRAVTFVTCSSMEPGQPWRTALTFCA